MMALYMALQNVVGFHAVRARLRGYPRWDTLSDPSAKHELCVGVAPEPEPAFDRGPQAR